MGLEEANGAVEKLFPNPSNGIVYVEMRRAGVVSVTSLTGQILYTDSFEQGKHSLDLRHLPKGVYILRSEGVRTRFVLQ